MASPKVLICGAGVSGSVLAYWLGKNDFDVHVIERSRADQKAGQGLEIEEPALSVVKAMGIIDELEQKKTGELGFQLENEHSHVYATMQAGGVSPTGALELMRGSLVETLYRAADKLTNVKYEYETTVSSITQTSTECIVELDTGRGTRTRTEEYDFVVGADGVKSRTRELVMGKASDLKCYKNVGAYCAYFSVPKQNHDWPYSRLCNFPGRRVMWIRPVAKDADVTSVYLIHLADHVPELRRANESGDRQAQKEAFATIFRNCGWEAPRIIEGMLKAQNFYSDELQQVKLSTWSKDRVALVGDSAWAPTPFTGEGNQLAIIGAWVLAQEMSRERTPLAFKNYERRLRKHVEDAQAVPLNGYAPYMCCPQTSFGISVFRNFFRSITVLVRFFTWANLGRFMPESKPEYFDLEMPSNLK